MRKNSTVVIFYLKNLLEDQDSILKIKVVAKNTIFRAKKAFVKVYRFENYGN